MRNYVVEDGLFARWKAWHCRDRLEVGWDEGSQKT
jgi:hypothetical protein